MTTISTPTTIAFNAPLTGPTSPRPLKQPEVSRPDPDLGRHLEDISARVDRKTIDYMMRHLDSEESKDYFKKIDTLLTPDNIRRLASGPNAKSHIKALAHIETRFNSGSLAKISGPLEWKHVEDYRKAVEAELFELSLSLFFSDGENSFELVRGFLNKETDQHILHAMHDLRARHKRLSEVSTLVKNILESVQDVEARAQDWRKGMRSV
ncbi:hypothetical protein [Pseudomonas trivialis]|uniref:Uncharacterized protein n=1 Tax=Pseudomonas trivialis TaxID=200450 RepID=A0A0R2ZGK0_9PSED|nr:hypothetical protein [Pseudomonas trivialis]KRP59357.1 hypothetical protein TU79_16270 [Pseudomonas trivialis]SDS79055.1 hypothetical protein SAMN04490205_3653 [Pseudomonas trivialis]